MWWIVIIILLILVVILIKTNNSIEDNCKSKNNVDRDYMDIQIMNQTLKHSHSLDRQQTLKRVENTMVDVTIEKFHSSNVVEGPVRGEYVKLYHESEGPVLYIDPSEIDEYRQRFTVFVWNSELGIKEKIIGCTVESVVEQCEKQFRKWADEVEKQKKTKKTTVINSSNKKSGVSQRQIPDMIFEVKGLTYRSVQAQLEAVLLEVGDQLLLEEEPDNEVDASAVKVLIPASGECIGYVDSEHCVSVGALINLIDNCTVIKKSRHQIPYITAKISFKE